MNRTRVFLCHAHEDKPLVRKLYTWLRANGYQPWLDEKDLLPGQEWEREIPQAVRGADCIIVFLSQHATTKRGYVQKEIRIALSEAEKLPEGAIFIIPLRVDDCAIPERLSKYQWLDYKSLGSKTRLLRTIQKVANASKSANLKRNSQQMAKGIAEGIRDLEKGFQIGEGVSELVTLHWKIGEHIVRYCQTERVAPSAIINSLAEQLANAGAPKFSVRQLRDMRQLYLAFPNPQILPRNLTAGHFRVLLRVDNREARMWYMMKAAMHGWSLRKLDRQIDTLSFERQFLGQTEITQQRRRRTASDAIRDPYVLEFLGLSNDASKKRE